MSTILRLTVVPVIAVTSAVAVPWPVIQSPTAIPLGDMVEESIVKVSPGSPLIVSVVLNAALLAKV